MRALVATRFGRSIMLLLAASALAAAAAGLRAARGITATPGPAHTLTGAAGPTGRITLALRGSEIASVRLSGLNAACGMGWSFMTPAGAATLTGLHVERDGAAFKATGSQRENYPDGSLGWSGRVSVAGNVGRAGGGTIEESVTLYAEGSVTGHCATGPVSFTAR